MPDNYRVGYCRPPFHTRFEPGKSPNPAGRPRGSKGLGAELRSELDERVSVTLEGRTRRFSKRRLIIKALAAKAAKGDVRAAEKLLSLVIQAEGFEDQRTARMSLSDQDAGELDAWLLDRMRIIEASQMVAAENGDAGTGHIAEQPDHDDG